MHHYRAVITSLGAITPIGATAPAFGDALVDGTSGGAPITRFDISDLKVTVACAAKEYEAAEHFDTV